MPNSLILLLLYVPIVATGDVLQILAVRKTTGYAPRLH